MIKKALRQPYIGYTMSFGRNGGSQGEEVGDLDL